MRRRAPHALLLGLALIALPAPQLAAQSTAPQVPTDWDLYMLRLVNRARTDPAGEDARQNTQYGASAAPPLAYDPLVGRAAANHVDWMGLNRDNPRIDNRLSSGPAPDSFSHYETFDGQFDGPPAEGTPGFSGAGIGDRLDYLGYSWSTYGENTAWGSTPAPIFGWLIDGLHSSWWNSEGHRRNLMDPAYTAFGYHARNDDDFWAEQMYARPAGSAPHYVFGLIYRDKNANRRWDPYDADSQYREGVADQTIRVFLAGTETLVEQSATMDNGAYSIALADGTYDIELAFDGIGQSYIHRGILVEGANVDLGDLDIYRGDLDWDGDTDFDDIEPFAQGLSDPRAYEELYGVPPAAKGDLDWDGDQDFDDIGGFVQVLTGANALARQVPEPTGGSSVAIALTMLVLAGARRAACRI